VRFVAEWALVAAPLAAVALEPIEGALGGLGRPALALCALLPLFDIAHARLRTSFDIGLAADVVPFDAIDFITRNGLRDRLYSDLDVGCYLLWEGWPRYRVFQDARLPAYPDDFHRALDETPLAPAAFDALLQRFSVDSALIAYPGVNMRAGSFDPEEWALVYRSGDALAFARRVPRLARVIAEYEIPLRVRFSFAHGSHVEPLRTPPARSPVDRAEWQRRLAREEQD
jgi:hypothetical protein